MGKKLDTACGSLVEELFDEVLRLRGRMVSATRGMNEARGLRHSQGLILTAVVRALEPPTVARIARSLGLTRQSVQRTANELADDGLVQFEDNPHHKRAKQLVATHEGLTAHARNADSKVEWTEGVGAAIGKGELEQTVSTLRRIRRYLEHPESFVDTTPETPGAARRSRQPRRAT